MHTPYRRVRNSRFFSAFQPLEFQTFSDDIIFEYPIEDSGIPDFSSMCLDFQTFGTNKVGIPGFSVKKKNLFYRYTEFPHFFFSSNFRNSRLLKTTNLEFRVFLVLKKTSSIGCVHLFSGIAHYATIKTIKHINLMFENNTCAYAVTTGLD